MIDTVNVPERFVVVADRPFFRAVGASTSRTEAERMADNTGGWVTTTSRYAEMLLNELPYDPT